MIAKYNNLVASNEWKENGKQTSNKEDVKFLTLSVQFKDLKKSLDSNSNSKSNSNSNSGNHNEDWKKSWMFQNTDGKIGKKMTRNGRTYYLCDKDCHARTQWCIRKVCMNRDDYKKYLTEKKDETSTQSSNYSIDFKVALAAMVSDGDYKTFEDQFFWKAVN